MSEHWTSEPFPALSSWRLSAAKRKELCTFNPRRSVIPARAQVAPCGILCDDHRDLLDAKEALDLFFSRDGVADVLETLEVNQLVQFVMLAELRSGVVFVFPDATKKIVGNTRVQSF
jgi:hypothetical protein